MTQLSAHALGEMVSTSLEIADTVLVNNLTAAGRTQDWKHAEWIYRPYRIRLIYTLASRNPDRKDKHTGSPLPEVGIFEWAWSDHPDEWFPLHSTVEYKELLAVADLRRQNM